MRIEWHTVGGICSRVYKEIESQSASRFDALVNIGIDETSYKKGHKYLTVVINHDTASVIWCGVGFGKDVLSRFFEHPSVVSVLMEPDGLLLAFRNTAPTRSVA